ncbi:MAG: flagellar hook-length control protein FliK [Alphaproteobacteria bacterium]|nr:flagellar hook-length control protein FliK [Alphaproteobacteria bacterium]
MTLSTELFTNVISAAPTAGGGQLVSGDGKGAQTTPKGEGKAFADQLVQATDEKIIPFKERLTGKGVSSEAVLLNALESSFGRVADNKEPEGQADIQTSELIDTDGLITDVIPEDQIVPMAGPVIAAPDAPVLEGGQNETSIVEVATADFTPENTAVFAPEGQGLPDQNLSIVGQSINIVGQKSEGNSLPKKDAPSMASPKVGASDISPKPTVAPAETSAEEISVVTAVANQAAALAENPAPVVTSQQAAIAAAPVPEKPEKNGMVKEADVKDMGKARSDGEAAGRYQVVDHKNASSQNKENSQNNGRNFTQTSSHKTDVVSNKAAGIVDTASISMSKTPFLTEVSQGAVSTEGRAIQMTSPQLATGLLSVQEVGQGANQHLSQANGLTQTGHARPQMLSVDPQMVAKQISMAIAKQSGGGQESFRITLKPAELGQVDIKMHFLAEGKVAATVTVESERTLQMLQRDQGSLVKILENAGFDAGGNSLNFTLKEQQQDMGQFEQADRDSGESSEHDFDQMPALSNSIISHQQMKMAYSDNLLDINI